MQDQTYKEISLFEYELVVMESPYSGDLSNLSNIEFDKVRKIFDFKKLRYFNNYAMFGYESEIYLYEVISDEFFLNLFSFKDEWFYVCFRYPDQNEICYKCDQFDGLISCLNFIKDNYMYS